MGSYMGSRYHSNYKYVNPSTRLICSAMTSYGNQSINFSRIMAVLSLSFILVISVSVDSFDTSAQKIMMSKMKTPLHLSPHQGGLTKPIQIQKGLSTGSNLPNVPSSVAPP